MKRNFRFSTLAGEAVRNQRQTTLLVPMVIFVVSLSAMLLSAVEVSNIDAQAARAVKEGANVFEITAEERAPLSASRCSELSSIDGVLFAGGIIRSEEVDFADASTRTAILMIGSADTASIFWPDLSPELDRSLVIGSRLARELGVTSGGRIELSDGSQLIVDQVAAPSSRGSQFDAMIFATDPLGRSVSSCFVEALPALRE